MARSCTRTTSLALLALVAAACTAPEEVPRATAGPVAAGSGPTNGAAAEAAAGAPAGVREPVVGLPGGTGTALDGAPLPPGSGGGGTPAAPSPEAVPVERVLPYLIEGARIQGVDRLATSSDGGLEALRIRAVADGVTLNEVLLLERDGELLLRLPPARAAGPGELRVGPVVLSLDDRRCLEELACGAIDLVDASAVLRLAGLVVEDALEQAAREGWGAVNGDEDPGVELLGVAPATSLLPGEVPTRGPMGVPRPSSSSRSCRRRSRASSRSTRAGADAFMRSSGFPVGRRRSWSLEWRVASPADASEPGGQLLALHQALLEGRTQRRGQGTPLEGRL